MCERLTIAGHLAGVGLAHAVCKVRFCFVVAPAVGFKIKDLGFAPALFFKEDDAVKRPGYPLAIKDQLKGCFAPEIHRAWRTAQGRTEG